MLREQADTIGVGVGKVAQYGGGLGAVGSGIATFTIHEIASLTGIVIGILIGVLGYFTNRHYSRRRDAREAEARAEQNAEHKARMAKIVAGRDE
jgi:predicted histidine transporter YuiF (NhaC family)